MSKKITGFKPGSKSWKKMMAKVYGWGGALVIVGAMFKIQHWPGAAIMLIGGLGVEAVIFILSAFDPLHEDPDWSLVHPELAALDDDEEGHEHAAVEGHGHAHSKDAHGASITQQLDDMLQEAKIEPALLESLGSGLRNLSDQAGKLNQITDASVATDKYVSSLQDASKSVSSLSASYTKASESLGIMSVSSEQGGSFGEQMQSISKNLSALNSLYEMQVNSAQQHMTTSTNFYDGIAKLVSNLNESVESTQHYKENISELAKNLSALNKVYGNMLNAMSSGSNH